MNSMKKTINLYLTKEILSPLFVTLLVFSFIFLTSNILRLTELMLNRGVELGSILRLILYTIPFLLVFTIPMSILVAVALAFGRLSGDGEITAMKASGISLSQLIAPVIAVSVFCYIVTSFLSIFAVPWANHSFNKLIFDIAKTKASIEIKERVFNDEFKELMLYVNEIPVKSKKLKGILVYEKGVERGANTIFAREGYIVYNPESLSIDLRLIDGNIHKLGNELNSYQKIQFSNYDINLKLGTLIRDNMSFTNEYCKMSIGELKKKVHELIEKNRSYYFPLLEIYKKFSLPFACIIFGIIAVPLGVQSKSSSRTLGVVVALCAFLAYYVSLTCVEVLAKNGRILPIVAVWTPNFLFGALGAYMLYKSVNELPIKVMEWGNIAIAFVFERMKKAGPRHLRK